MFLPAVAMIAPVGVMLDARLSTAQAAGTYIFSASKTATVNLSAAGYGGANIFTLSAPFTITNTTAAAVVGDASQSWTFTNQSSIGNNSTTAAAVTLISPSYFHNAGGTVSGGSRGLSLGDNTGTSSGFTVTNSSTSTISASGASSYGAIYGYLNARVTLTNAGHMTAAQEDGVRIKGGGVITNQSTGYVYGVGGLGVDALRIENNAATISNAGTIKTSNTNGEAGIYSNAAGTTIFNDTTGLISGRYGARVTGLTTITNLGTFQDASTANGFNAGILMQGGGVITNGDTSHHTALITGGKAGVNLFALGGTVLNDGIIRSTNSSGTSSGVYLSGGGGNIVNYAGGTITGGVFGVLNVDNHVAAVSNAGTITGHTGVDLEGGGYLINTTSGVIAGTSGVGVKLSSGVGTVINTGTVTGTTQAISLAGGYVRNGSTLAPQAYIGGGSGSGVYIGGTGTLVNYGAVKGTGVALHGGTIINKAGGYIGAGGEVVQSLGTLMLTNAGTIQGGNGAVITQVGNLYVTNLGSITGGTDFGVKSAGGGSIQNGNSTITNALISGANTAVSLTNTGTVSNFATITGTGTAVGVQLAGGTVTNSGTAALISGGTGVIATATAATVSNTGTITGTAAEGILLSDGGTVINGGSSYATARITGATDGVSLAASGSVINYGHITGGASGSGVNMQAGGTVGNAAGGTITGYYGVLALGVGTVSNAGIISSNGTGNHAAGVYLADGGIVSNTANITGYTGVTIKGGLGTVSNSGTILGTQDRAVYFTGGGYVGNLGTNARISGEQEGVYLGDAGSVFNQGAIIGNLSGHTYAGVSLSNGGTVTNSGTASYIGGYRGLTVNGAGIVTNEGTIKGTSAEGVMLISGTVTNAATGFIIGGVNATTGLVSILNSGVISGNNVAAQLAFAGDSIQNLGTFSGGNHGVYATASAIITNGSSSNSAARITSTASQGIKLSGASATFTVTNYGTIDGAGGLSIGTTTGSSTIVNAGVISSTASATGPGISTSGLVTITNSGTIAGGSGTSTGVLVQAGGTVTNSTTGVISGGAGVSGAGTGFTLANYGSIGSTTGTAISLGATSNVLVLGTGSSETGAINGAAHVSAITLKGTDSITNTFANFGAGSTLTVASGASWIASGTWQIPSVTNAGTLQPGVAGSPLNLTGNFVAGSGSTLASVLTASGGASFLNVTGSASLTGSTLAITAPAGLNGASSRTYTVVTASTGVIGTFTGVSGGTVLLPATLSYDANDAYVTLGQQTVSTGSSSSSSSASSNSTGNSSQTRNEKNFAAAFDTAYASDPATFGPVLGALDRIPTQAQLNAAIDVLEGQNNADLSSLAFTAGTEFLNLFQQHSFTTMGNTEQDDPWISGFVQSGEQDSGGAGASKLNEGVTGGAIGADHVFFSGFRLGLMAGMGEAHARLAGGSGLAKVYFEQAAVTADYTDGNFYSDVLVGYAYNHATATRDASLPGLPAIATAHPKSDTVIAGGEMGYTIASDDVASLVPFVGFDYVSNRSHALAETGAGALDLTVAAHTDDSQRSILGARVNFGNWTLAGLAMNLETKIGWAHEFANRNPVITESFAVQTATHFTITGAPLPGDSTVAGLGLTAAIAPGTSIHLRYDGAYAGTSTSHTLSGGLSIDW